MNEKLICSKCANGIMTMDRERRICPYCGKYFFSPSIPGYCCCSDCALKNGICQICGKKLNND